MRGRRIALTLLGISILLAPVAAAAERYALGPAHPAAPHADSGSFAARSVVDPTIASTTPYIHQFW